MFVGSHGRGAALPIDCWLDLQRLLWGRHGSPSKTLVRIYEQSNDPDVRLECAYQAAMPGTGLYSAKYYGDIGSTELMSMTLQCLCAPDTAKELIEQDPQLAAIVPKWLAPGEFSQRVGPELRSLALPTMY